MKRTLTLCLSCGLLLGTSLPSFAGDDKIEDAIEYRQAVFEVIAWNFGPLAAMVKGKMPYDAALFMKHAERMAFMSPMAGEGFIPGSDKGHDTEAKAKIWDNLDDFNAKMEDMQAATQKLAELSKQGDLKVLKPQLAATGKTCKSCHDEYRED